VRINVTEKMEQMASLVHSKSHDMTKDFIENMTKTFNDAYDLIRKVNHNSEDELHMAKNLEREMMLNSKDFGEFINPYLRKTE